MIVENHRKDEKKWQFIWLLQEKTVTLQCEIRKKLQNVKIKTENNEEFERILLLLLLLLCKEL